MRVYSSSVNDRFGVSAVASLAGVTVRTLHHYDEIGLLEPSSRTTAGYRQYTATDLARLQSIMFYRELGLSLDDIAAAMKQSASSRLALLEEQRRLLAAERDRVGGLVEALSRAINAEKSGVMMNPDEMFEVFGDFDPQEHAAEAAERWPDVYEQSNQRTAKYGREQWQQAVAEGEAIATEFADLLRSGAAAESGEAVAVAEKHRLSIDRWYYRCSAAQHAGLADMYLADSRFTQYWEDRCEGLALFVHDAIKANAAS